MRLSNFYLHKKLLAILIVSFIILIGIGCSKEKKDDSSSLIGLFLLNQTKSSSNTVASEFPNSVTGDSTSVQAASSTSSASSSATSSVTNSASAAATSVLEPSLKEAILKSKNAVDSRITLNATVCNGVKRTATGSYTTTTTVTGSTTSLSLTSGSYTIKPNISTTVTYICTMPSSTTTSYTSTSEFTYSYSGTLEITFTNATIRYFDIESYVKSATFMIKTATLGGTISISDISQSSSENSNKSYDAATGKYVNLLSLNYTYSDKARSSTLTVDSGTAASFDVTSSSKANLSTTYQYTGNFVGACYSAFSVEQGNKVSGTYNGSTFSASYNFTSEDYKKYLTTYFGSSAGVTMCSSVGTVTAPSALTYTGSPYSFKKDTAITTQTPTVTGTVTSCNASPTLPTGLSINTTTCAISGTPTVTQSATSYTITATNSAGSTTATISIAVDIAPTISFTGSPYTFAKGSAITTQTPTITGTVTSCTASPTLPTGLSISTTTCAISGTPTVLQPATSYTITAANAFGNTTATISIAISTCRIFFTTYTTSNCTSSITVSFNSSTSVLTRAFSSGTCSEASTSQTTTYSSVADFVNEVSVIPPRGFATASTSVHGATSVTYNGSNQLSSLSNFIGSVAYSATITAWDSINRPTTGTISFTSTTCLNRPFTITYDNTARTELRSVDQNVVACGSKAIPYTVKLTYDSNGQLTKFESDSNNNGVYTDSGETTTFTYGSTTAQVCY